MSKIPLRLINFDAATPDDDQRGILSPVFRPCLPSEHEQIKQQVLEVLAEHSFTYDPILNYDLDHIGEVYGSGLSKMFVVVYRDSVIGTHAVCDMLDGTIYCRRLTLKKSYRGNGWLYPQLQYAKDYCISRSFRSMRFDTLRSFGMIPSFEKFGYQVTHEEPEGAETKVFMQLDLG